MALKAKALSWCAIAVALAVNCLALPARAAWPEATIKIILPFTPGGSADLTARLLAQKMTDKLGRAVIVENRVGANGRIGANAVIRAKDGHTFLVTPNGPITIVSQVQKSEGDIEKDLVPVSLLVRVPVGIAVHPSTGIKSIKDLIQWAKANPDKLNYAVPAIATHMHLVGAMFAQEANIKMTPVPFRGTSEAGGALMAGHVQMAIGDLTSLAPLKESGVQILAVCDPQRTVVAPELPTVAEQGLPGFGLSAWIAMFAPAGTPQDVVEKLEATARQVMGDPEMQAALRKIGLEPVGSSAAELKAIVRSDIEKLSRVIAATNIKQP